MACSSMLAKRAVSPCLINKLNILRSVSATRAFNTNAAQLSNYDDHDVDHRRSAPSATRRREPDFFSVFDPFVPTRSLSQVLNLMDQFTESPFASPSRGLGLGSGSRRSWDVKENDEALLLRMDMPGLGKEDVNVSMEQNTLTIRGEGKSSEGEDEEGGRRYSSRIDLPAKMYKVDGIKAEMKNGVLKVMVPKVKEDEKKNVFQINVD